MENASSNPAEQPPGAADNLTKDLAQHLYAAFVDSHPNEYYSDWCDKGGDLSNVTIDGKFNMHAVAAVFAIRMHALLAQVLSPLPRKR